MAYPKTSGKRRQELKSIRNSYEVKRPVQKPPDHGVNTP
jgi:hypothetical protein